MFSSGNWLEWNYVRKEKAIRAGFFSFGFFEKFANSLASPSDKRMAGELVKKIEGKLRASRSELFMSGLGPRSAFFFQLTTSSQNGENVENRGGKRPFGVDLSGVKHQLIIMYKAEINQSCVHFPSI